MEDNLIFTESDFEVVSKFCDFVLKNLDSYNISSESRLCLAYSLRLINGFVKR